MPVPKQIMEQIRMIIPPLNGKLHKGQSGRVGVLGGAMDYTGAPFFASMASMRLGADMAHVICAPSAAGALKSYAPDLIVHPILREDAPADTVRSELQALLARLHVLVLGPGLGREAYMQAHARTALALARERGMYVVLDADGLWMAGQDLGSVRGYRRAVLTPNVMEFKRLSEAADIDPKTPAAERATQLSRALGGVLVVQKGPTDLIAADTMGPAASAELSHVPDDEAEALSEVVEVDAAGGLKRCGGQGDVLSGTIGAFLAFGKCYEDGAFGDGKIPPSRIPILAATAGSLVTRTTSRLTYEKAGRSMVTQDMLPEIANAFAEVFGEETQGRSSKRVAQQKL